MGSRALVVLAILASLTVSACGGSDGTSVTTVLSKDIDGDGNRDLIVGAMQAGAGEVHIFFGPAFANPADVVITGETVDDDFGVDVDASGDLNGDGIADLIVGASDGPSPSDADGGSAYVFFGRSDRSFPLLAAAADIIIDADPLGGNFGIDVLLADLNGDGLAEAIVGDPAFNANEGRVYIFQGAPGLTSAGPLAGDADQILTGDPAETGFLGTTGPTADEPGDLTAGDVNRDGITDLAVGSPRYFDGFVHVFFGSPAGVGNRSLLAADMAIDGNRGANVADDFGAGVVIADLNGDTIPDIGVGDPDPSGNPANDGIYFLFFGTEPLTVLRDGTTADVTLDNATPTMPTEDNEDLGSEAGVGDVNGDGFIDLVIGDEEGDDPVFDTGTVYIFFGPNIATQTVATADVKITGVSTHDTVGRSLSICDYDNDGVADVAIGAEDDANGGPGRVLLFFGRVIWPTAMTIAAADVTLTGTSADGNFGNALAE